MRRLCSRAGLLKVWNAVNRCKLKSDPLGFCMNSLRRSRTFLVAVLCFLFATSCNRPEETDHREAPAPRDANVLLITLDTTRADHLSCYASSLPATQPYHGAKT